MLKMPLHYGGYSSSTRGIIISNSCLDSLGSREMAHGSVQSNDHSSAARISILEISSGIVLLMTSFAIGSISLEPSLGISFSWSHIFTPIGLPALLGILVGPISVVGGVLVFSRKGFKFALAGAIGVTTISTFALVLSIGLFAVPEIVVTILLIDMALLYCLISGILCCDALLRLKESRYGI